MFYIVQTKGKWVFLGILMLLATTNSVFSQNPSPTPPQYPNFGWPSNGCSPPQPDCEMVTRDDSFRIASDAAPFRVRSNDINNNNIPTGGEIYMYSQTGTYGIIEPQADFSQASTSQRAVIGYIRNANGNYGVDTGYYYLKPQFQNFASNLAKVTILVTPNDDAENAGVSCPVVGAPVNVVNGNMWLQQLDYSLPGIGERIEINRFYNSIIQRSGYFGFGWSTKYDESLEIYDNNLVRLNLPDGRSAYFVRQDSSNYFAPATPQSFMRVDKNSDNTYDVTYKDGGIHRFNSTGKLLWEKDRNGNQTILNYNSSGILTGLTEPSGRTLTINLNTDGLVDSISDSLGTIAAYTYYLGTAKLKDVTYQDGSKYKFEYTTVTVNSVAKILLTTVKDALDNILETHEYDSKGRAITSEKQGGVEKYTFAYLNNNAGYIPDYYTLVKHKKNPSDTNFIETKYHYQKTGNAFSTSRGRDLITKIEGNCNCGGGAELTNFEYDYNSNIKKTTNALGQATNYTYDSNGNVLSVQDIYGTVAYTYNNFGQILTAQDRMSGVWTVTYDVNGNTKTIKDPLNKITTLEYPATGNKGQPDSIKDARNNITKFKWFSVSGLLQEVEDPYNKKTNFTYDARGRTKTVTNALNHITTYNYFDDTQRKVEMIYPNSDKITYNYNIRRLLESVTDERGKITNYEFDPAYRLTKITDPLGHYRQYGYDLMSNLASYTDPLGNVTNYKYDNFDRLSEVENPAATSGVTRLKETYSYDAIGRIKNYYDTANRPTQYSYNDTTRTNTVIDADSKTTTAKYNQRFQMIEVKDALNQVYQFDYDPLGRMTSQIRAAATMNYEYDAVGNRTKRTDYAGRITDYTYDNLNRLTKTLYNDDPSNPAPKLQSTYGYDEISRLVSAVNEVGTVSFNYDNRNRTISTTDVFGHIVAYEYQLTSTVNQTRLKLDGALYSAYNFDDADRLSNIVNSEDSTTTAYGYDDEDKLTSRTLPNGITTTYEYDNIDRLKRLKDVSSTATLFDRQYGYDTASQISSINEPTNSRSFGYDPVNRLKTVTASNNQNESYNYDGVGNRTSSHLSNAYGYQANNKLTSTQTGDYSYDANGNMLSKSDVSGHWIYGFDNENRMTTARKQNKTVRYEYDALGRRVSRRGKYVGESAKYTYDGQDVILDDTSDGIVKYQNGLGIDNKLSAKKGTNTSYFLSDHLGSTNGLADASGNLTSSASYDSFGNATGNLSTRYQFTGREKDEFTGLQYSRARNYDSKLGRFTSADPIGFGGGDVNLYGYVWNNPQQFTDPMGLDGGWGSELADQLDDSIALARDFYKANPGYWGWNGTVDTIADLASGFPDLLRVGNGTGHALYCDDNIYGQAAYILMDVERAAGIFGLLGGPAARLAGSSSEATSALNCLKCFEGETDVQTEDGLKPIEKIEVGDEVLSYNEETGFLEYKKVLQKMSRYADDIYNIKIEGESKPLAVTSEHPFFIRFNLLRDGFRTDSEGEWREVRDLKAGDEIRLASGLWAKVLEVKFKGEGQVYNFEVEGNHNYFVGNLHLLTHNIGCKRGPKTNPNAPHNSKIREVGNQVADGEIVAGGGRLPEQLIKTPGGIKSGRRPDILVERPDGSRYGINVGKQSNRTGAPIKREAQAIQDLEGSGVPMHFVPYN